MVALCGHPIYGHLVMMEPNLRGHCKQPLVNDKVFSWIQVYSHFMAVLLATSKEEAAVLTIHIHLIIQLCKI